MQVRLHSLSSLCQIHNVRVRCDCVQTIIGWAEYDNGDFCNHQTVPIGFTALFVGIFGAMSILWKEALASAVRQAMNAATRTDAKATTHVIFASMRFPEGQPLPEAIALRTALQSKGIALKIIEIRGGDDITKE